MKTTTQGVLFVRVCLSDPAACGCMRDEMALFVCVERTSYVTLFSPVVCVHMCVCVCVCVWLQSSLHVYAC